jgi:hypothetical protein
VSPHALAIPADTAPLSHLLECSGIYHFATKLFLEV